MRILLTGTMCLSLATAAYGFEWKTGDGDERLSKQAVAELVTGQKVKIGENGWTEFQANGDYRWKGRDEERKWYIKKDGTVCVNHPSGNRRCDIFVRNGAEIFLINHRGKRYSAVVE